MTESSVTYIAPNRTDAGAVPKNTVVATHDRQSDGAEVQDVFIDPNSVIPLPTGAATSANQTNGTQKTKITDGAGVVNTKQLGTAVSSSDIGLITNSVIHGQSTAGGGSFVDVKVSPSGAVQVGGDVNVADGGGSLTVDGTVAVSNFPATYPVTDNGGSLTVDGTVGVSNFPSVYPVTFPAANMSAFGTLETNELTPVFQDDFASGLNIQKWQSSYTFTVTSPGTPPAAGDIYTVNNQTFTVVLSSGTTLITIGSGAPPASGNLTRVTGTGTTPIAFSAFTTQVGVQNGTGASVDTNAGRLRVQSGTAATGYAYIASRRIIKYRPGQGATIRFTPLFTAGAADNLELIGIGTIVNNAPFDGYFLGTRALDGAFGIHHYISGSPTFTAQSSFNGDTLNGNGASGVNLNITFGTPIMIKYPYLGYGDIMFYAQNPTTGAWILFHTIRYANTTATTQLSNPNLQFIVYTLNSGNTTNKTLYCGSVGCFVSGQRSFIANTKWGIDSTKTSITTETNLLTLRNANSYNGTTGRGLIRLVSIGVSETTVTASNVTIRLKIGAALGGSPSFTAISGTTSTGGVVLTSANSIASYDTAGTTVTGGTYIWNMQIGSGNNGGSNFTIDLTPFEIFVAPGETLTISATSPNNASVGCSVNWSED